LPGVTAIETRAMEFTFKVAEAFIAPTAAVIVVEPPLKPLASPPLTIVAMAGWEELQLAERVRSCVLPSAYSPVATNCWF